MEVYFLSSLEINSNATLRAKLAEYTTNADANSFGLQHFTNNNPDFLELMFNNLHRLQFEGIVVRDVDDLKRQYCDSI